MPRMHGEHRKDYAGRQLAKALPAAPSSDNANPVYVATRCICASRPYPHQHPLNERQAAVARWNRESAHKIALPKQ